MNDPHMGPAILQELDRTEKDGSVIKASEELEQVVPLPQASSLSSLVMDSAEADSRATITQADLTLEVLIVVSLLYLCWMCVY